MSVMPHRVGILIDVHKTDMRQDCFAALQMAIDEALADGRLDRPVELLVATESGLRTVPPEQPAAAADWFLEGLPRANARRIVDGYRALVDAGCVLVFGPTISLNAMVVRPYLDAWRVPALTWTGTQHFQCEYGFNLGNGSIAEEAILMAAWLRRAGLRRVAVLRERNLNGEEYRDNFERICARYDLEIAYDGTLAQVQRDAGAVLGRMRRADAEAVAYFGYGLPALHLGPAMRAMGWEIARVMCGAFQFAYSSADFMRALEGWVGVCQMCEDNPRLASLRRRYLARTGRAARHPILALSYDTGQVIAEALARAPVVDGPGVKTGLERIQLLPAFNGAPRTSIGFGPHDRRGYKGDYLVLRRIENGESRFEGLMEHPAGAFGVAAVE